MYGQPSEHPPLDWEWVQEQLESAGTYWVIPRRRPDGYPHPRPVWGVWLDDALHLSIGSPVIRRALAADPRVTVHLESGTDVVVVEGRRHPRRGHRGPAVLAAYDAKYDWQYDEARYGPISRVAPQTVLAWRTAGWAGRESFQRDRELDVRRLTLAEASTAGGQPLLGTFDTPQDARQRGSILVWPPPCLLKVKPSSTRRSPPPDPLRTTCACSTRRRSTASSGRWSPPGSTPPSSWPRSPTPRRASASSRTRS